MENNSSYDGRTIDRFPKSKEILQRDPMARAFLALLLKGSEPYAVMDEMIFRYTELLKNQRAVVREEILHEFRNRTLQNPYTPESQAEHLWNVFREDTINLLKGDPDYKPTALIMSDGTIVKP